MTESEMSKVDVGKLLNTAGGIILAITTGLVSWGLGEVADLKAEQHAMDKRVTTIEANRFSVKDGKELWQEIAAIRTTLAKLPAEYPQPWFRKLVEERFAVIQENQESTRKAIEALARKIESR